LAQRGAELLLDRLTARVGQEMMAMGSSGPKMGIEGPSGWD